MGTKLIANNKKAYHDYFVIEKYECGIELKGTEVKSLRLSNCSIKESLCKILGRECYIIGMNISPYEKGNIFNVDPVRTRKLLLHKREIRKIEESLKLKGYTLIPLQVYFKDSRVKVEIGLCKGKKLYDKREDLKKKDMKRAMERNL
ncbi:MAG: SsrA-binding protein SmpB [Lachnospiraceae bacterium]|nr:SsrA-binding protein SmpB [Lachnospiraceae bacterium]MBR1844360.1 SsrA-binding protein SmpB [Lachnospiraceae bacterium]